MNIKQKMQNIIIMLTLLFGVAVVAMPTATYATCSGSTQCNNSCGVDTAIIKCNPNSVTNKGLQSSGVWALLLMAINILTGLIVVAAIGGLVYAAILYTSSGGNADQTKKAIEFIRNVIIGIVAYAVMFAALNFIIPGGLFN
jgi:hypothetical protein